MKHTFLIAAIPILFLGCSTPSYLTVDSGQNQQPAYTDNSYTATSDYSGPTETSYQIFYDQLSPYGTWMEYPEYGYVWHPNADPDFQPYATNGHWVYSNEGWTWVSDYPWGWAPFHYGRWFLDNNVGWLWVPGHQWASAWVTWGRSGDYYGWAPLPPDADAGAWTPPTDTWNFVPAQHMTRPNLATYVVNNRSSDVTNITRNVTVINNVTRVNNVTNQVSNSNTVNNSNSSSVNNSTVNTNVTNNRTAVSSNVTTNNTVSSDVNNNTSVTNNVSVRPNANPADQRPLVNQRVHVISSTVYNRGPAPVEVEKLTNTPVRPVTITTRSQPGKATINNNTLSVYRPVVRPAVQNNNGKPAAPASVQRGQPHN